MPRNVWQSSHVFAGISMCFSFLMFLFKDFFSLSVVRCQSLTYSFRDTMKQNLQGNVLLEFPLIRLNVTDFSLLFNFFFFVIQEAKNIDYRYSALPSNHILYLVVPKSTKSTLSFISVLHLFFLWTLNMSLFLGFQQIMNRYSNFCCG